MDGMTALSSVRRWAVIAALGATSLLTLSLAVPVQSGGPVTNDAPSHLARAKVYLAAGDYRRALEASQRQVDEAPSAASYVYLTYIYHAIDGYVAHLAKTEHLVAVEHLYVNLAYRDAQDLIDPPGGLARMAQEVITTSVRQQADLAAAMATRLDQAKADHLWEQQAAWRLARPESWWFGVPDSWGW